MRFFWLTVLLAYRNLQRNSRRTLFTMAALSFSVVALLVFGSLKEGLHKKMVETATQFDIGTLQIRPVTYSASTLGLNFLPEPQKIHQRIHELRDVSFAPRLSSQALVLAEEASAAALVSGVRFQDEGNVTRLASLLIAGHLPEAEDTILVGKGLAVALGLQLHDTLQLVAQDSIGETVSRSFEVEGIYETGVATVDNSRLFVSLSSMQQFLNAPDRLTEIVGRSALHMTEDRAVQLRALLHTTDRVQVVTWEDIVPDVEQLIELNSVTMNILVGIVFFIVAMGITNTMTTITFERFREFGVLSALGTTPGGIVGLVCMESSMLGGFGALVGGGIGFVVCSVLARQGIDLSRFTSANQYFAGSHVLKAVITWETFAVAIMLTLFVSFLAGMYPAVRAARLESSTALTHV